MHLRTLPRRFLLAALAVLLLAAGFCLAGVFWVRRSSPPHGPYLQSVTTDSIWIVWDTRQPSIGRLEYGLTSAMGKLALEQQTSTHHELQLTGLEPYTRYFYQVDRHKVSSFLTAASPEQTRFRFAVYGDTREGYTVHRAIVNQIVKLAPDFVLNTGDLVESGDCLSCWDDFFRAEASLLRSTPFYPTLGNHEDDQSPFGQTLYFDIFHLPGVERWYSFDYGNARFISLKADGYPVEVYFPDSEQIAWLEQQLQTNGKPWTFVFFHIGVYTSRNEDFLELGMRQRLAPLFERYGVEAVFMGHNHGYERVEVNGITYITAAGGGAPLYNASVPEPGSQSIARTFHFVLLEMAGDRLLGTTIDNHGKTIDQFQLTPTH